MSQVHIPTPAERRSLIRASRASPQIELLVDRKQDDRVYPPRFPRGGRQRDLSHALIVGISNIPDEKEHEVVKAAFPAASDVLDRWRANWNRIKDSNPLTPGLLRERGTPSAMYKTEIEWKQDRRKRFDEVIDGTYVGRDGMRRLLHADYYERHLQGRQRNFLHHYVDDAFSFFSLASAQPGMAVLWTPVHDLMLFYTGVDEDGFLTFTPLHPYEREKVSKTIKERHEDDGKYWLWEPIRKGMRRESEEAVDHLGAADILLDMAKRGHRRAFVKAIRSKCGTWTVDLTGVVNYEDALRSLIRDGFDSSENFRYGLVVQEHLPTTREQRFFVTNGRIVASVCSDRNLNGTNLREERYFDERVAIIERPEVDGGEFERGQTAHEVDRPLAAAFAREARKIVREMRAEGRMHYVVDIGFTARGVVAIEINSFFRSGPYCLDRRRVAAAHRRSLTAEQIAVAGQNMALSREERDRRAGVQERHEMLRRSPSHAAGLPGGPRRFSPHGVQLDPNRADENRSNADNVRKALEALNFEPVVASSDDDVKSFAALDRVREQDIHDMADRIATNDSVMNTLQFLDFESPKSDPPELDPVIDAPDLETPIDFLADMLIPELVSDFVSSSHEPRVPPKPAIGPGIGKSRVANRLERRALQTAAEEEG
jgi:hypothetical protein